MDVENITRYAVIATPVPAVIGVGPVPKKMLATYRTLKAAMESGQIESSNIPTKYIDIEVVMLEFKAVSGGRLMAAYYDAECSDL